MTTQEAVAYFGGKKIDLAKALGIRPSAVTMWGDEIPMLRQYQIEHLTKGELQATPEAA